MGSDKKEKKDKKDKKDKKEKREKVEDSEEAEKAAKKAAKKAKKEAEAAAAAGGEDDEAAAKAAKKAAKKAKREAEEAAVEEESPAKKAKAEEAAPDAGLTRVFVGNLPFSMTDDWMKEEFQSIGTIEKVEWLSHSDTGRFKGTGFLTFSSAAEASAATSLNGKELEGRPMKVEVAMPRKPMAAGGFAGHGADGPGEPSESIFVGNLSWTVTDEGLRGAFAECGTITNIKYLEKDGEFRGICFIDFETVDAATKAVALAGTDICGRPARINFSKKKEDKWGAAGGGGGGKQASPGRVERPYKPSGPKPDECTELFCGNLPWSIDEDKIAAFFSKSGATVTGTRWLNDKATGEFKGVGFVTFSSTEDVDKAVTLGGEQLEGRAIRLDYAGQKPKPKENAWGGGGGW